MTDIFKESKMTPGNNERLFKNIKKELTILTVSYNFKVTANIT